VTIADHRRVLGARAEVVERIGDHFGLRTMRMHASVCLGLVGGGAVRQRA